MTGTVFRIFQCTNPGCSFRCPITPTDPDLFFCPECHSAGKISTHQFPEPESNQHDLSTARSNLEVLLDNIRSTYNVGSIFRTSDGAGVQKLYLGGYTPTPDHPKLKKTGLGSEWEVPWEKVRNGLELARIKKASGYQIWSLEKMPAAVSLFDGVKITETSHILLILGNEKTGVDPEILALSNRILFIPMAGMKRSLNVASAYGIAAYFLSRFSPTGI